MTRSFGTPRRGPQWPPSALAVDRDFKDRNTGEKATDFIDIVAWRQTGEFVSKYFTKGRMAVVEGRLQMRDWTDKEGNKRRSAEVVADNVYFGDSKRDGDGGSYGAPGGYGFNQTPAPSAAPVGGYGAPMRRRPVRANCPTTTVSFRFDPK